MPDIFLSYKREDARAAAKLVEGLREVGFQVWWDVDIPAGAAWEATIERSLVDAKVVLVCWSRAAVASDNVRSEARWAREQGRLIQLFVEPCDPPLFFGERQGVDVAHWSGDAADPRFQRLVAQLRTRLDDPGAVADPSRTAADPARGETAPPATELATWLKTLDLDRYAAAFEAAEVNLTGLRDLDDADFREIGIPLGPRRRIIAALASAPPAAAPPAPAPAPAPVAPSEAPRPNTAERRQITVMSIDLVDSARLSAEVDPEELADLLARYKDRVVGVVGATGGWVAKATGGGVLAYFGWPQAREDAAECAVRSGFQVVAEVGRLDGPEGRPLGCRVGIATGLVVVGGEGGAPHEVSIAGEAPNLAAGLQQLAAPGTVAIAEATHRQIGQLFACEALAAQPVGGFATPVRAWRPLREMAHVSRFKAARGTRTSFVGRAHELSLLTDRWRIASEGTGRTVVIFGEAGMGKSRLADALQDRIVDEPHQVITWQCSPYHQTKAFYPVVEYLTHAAGIADDDGPAGQLRKLTALLTAARMPLDDNLALFAQLLAIQPDAGYAPPALPPNQARTATIAALTEWLRQVASVEPLLFLLEDAHWIDATTLELLTRLVGSTGDVALLTIITARPEFVSPWSGRAEVSTIGLDRLTNRDCEALAREVAGSAALQTRLVEKIVSRSDGNPLFVEELSAAVSETEASAAQAVPDSLQSSLMARLDRLGEAKQTAQICSVLGRRFARPLLAQVAMMAPALLATNLSLLVEHDVIRPIGGAAEGRYEFKHALVRDAAYESMLLSQRRRLHEACGRYLEQSFPDVARTEPELLAQHFGLAGSTQQASVYAEQAGDRATAAWAFHEAIANYEEALRHLDLLPAGTERDRRTLAVLLKLGPAIGTIRGAQDVGMRDVYARAEALSNAVDDTDALFKSIWGRWYHANIARELEDASRFAGQLVDIGRQTGDEELVLESIHCRWSTECFRGEYVQCVDDARRGTELYDRHRHHQLGLVYGGHDPGVCAHGCMGQALMCIGDTETAFTKVTDAIALGELLDHPGSLAHGIQIGMTVSTIAQAPELLRPYAERMLALAARFKLPPQQAMATYHLAWAEAETGDRAKGLDQMATLHDRVTVVGPMILLYRIMYVDQLLKAGRAQEALGFADKAIAEMRFPDLGFPLPELLRLRGDCLMALGRRREGVAELVRAEAIATRQGAGLLRLRAAVSLCRDGNGESEGRQRLVAALATFPSNWAGPDIANARALAAG